MSYLGAIRFVLTTDGCSVSDVSIEPVSYTHLDVYKRQAQLTSCRPAVRNSAKFKSAN